MSTGHMDACSCAECAAVRASRPRPTTPEPPEVVGPGGRLTSGPWSGWQDLEDDPPSIVVDEVNPPPPHTFGSIVVGVADYLPEGGGRFVTLVVQDKEGRLRAVYWHRTLGMVAPRIRV